MKNRFHNSNSSWKGMSYWRKTRVIIYSRKILSPFKNVVFTKTRQSLLKSIRVWLSHSAVVGNILAKLRKWKFHSRHNFWQGKRIWTPFLTKIKMKIPSINEKVYYLRIVDLRSIITKVFILLFFSLALAETVWIAVLSPSFLPRFLRGAKTANSPNQ